MGHVIERETDRGKSDSLSQCPSVVFIVLKLFIVAMRFVVFVGSARASSWANIIRVRLCIVHVALVVEKMSLERKVVGSAARDRARRHVGGRRRSIFSQLDLQRVDAVAGVCWVLRNVRNEGNVGTADTGSILLIRHGRRRREEKRHEA